MNVHAHLLALDGVYVRDASNGALVFLELPEPSAADVAEVAQRTARRLVEVLHKHGRQVDSELAEMDVLADDAAEETSALAACIAAAAAGTDLFGERAGSPALRLVDPSQARPDEPVAIALIPAPGFNMVRYYGVLSNRSSLREQVVPKPPPTLRNPLLDDDPQLALGFDGFADGEQQTGSAARRPWAWLLRHVWQVDVSICQRCGGPMKWVQVATDSKAIAKALQELGLGEPERESGLVGDGAHQKPKRRQPPVGQLELGFG